MNNCISFTCLLPKLQKSYMCSHTHIHVHTYIYIYICMCTNMFKFMCVWILIIVNYIFNFFSQIQYLQVFVLAKIYLQSSNQYLQHFHGSSRTHAEQKKRLSHLTCLVSDEVEKGDTQPSCLFVLFDVDFPI